MFEITGPREDIFHGLTKGTRFRFKSGKTWYVAQGDGEYISESSGLHFWSYSQQGGWFTGPPNVTLVVDRKVK